MRALVDRRGVIEFRARDHGGLLTLARGDLRVLKPAVEVIARHAYDGKTLLVPGVPEAKTDDEALDAVLAFQDQLRKRLPQGYVAPKRGEVAA